MRISVFKFYGKWVAYVNGGFCFSSYSNNRDGFNGIIKFHEQRMNHIKKQILQGKLNEVVL